MKLIVAVFTIWVCHLPLDAEGNNVLDASVPNTDVVTIIRGILKEQALMKQRENETKKEIDVLKKRENETKKEIDVLKRRDDEMKIKMLDMKQEIEVLKKKANSSIDISAGKY